MVNKELVYIAWMASGGILFALGGTGNWPLASKTWRRYGLPIACLGFYIVLGNFDWRIVASCVALGGVLHLGYGEGKSWWYRGLVACSYAVPSMIFGLNIWQVILPVAFVGLMKMSQSKWFKSQVVWKTVEFMAGLLIVLTFIGNLSH